MSTGEEIIRTTPSTLRSFARLCLERAGDFGKGKGVRCNKKCCLIFLPEKKYLICGAGPLIGVIGVRQITPIPCVDPFPELRRLHVGFSPAHFLQPSLPRKVPPPPIHSRHLFSPPTCIFYHLLTPLLCRLWLCRFRSPVLMCRSLTTTQESIFSEGASLRSRGPTCSSCLLTVPDQSSNI